VPFVRMQDGSFVEVGSDALFNDEGQTPLNIPTGPVFTADDLERVRSEEKDKLYGRIDSLTETINGLKKEVGGLTAEEQRVKAAAEEERARLEAEARAKEAEELDAKSLLAKREQEWRDEQARLQSDWEKRFETLEQQRANEAALREKEREFNDLKDYTQAQVAANSDKIAPQLLGWITGNSREEIDAAVARAIATTDALVADMQQSMQQVDPALQQQVAVPAAPPATPGTRVTAAPGTDPGAQFQTLTQEQIARMPMDEYAKLRGTLGIGGQSNARGLYG
jgi:hypothetical protein